MTKLINSLSIKTDSVMNLLNLFVMRTEPTVSISS